MKFCLIDKIIALEKDKSIEAIKNLTMGEEYLKDHFPGFPVMPGVLMLEAMVQSAAWLLRLSTDFAPTIITLAEVANIRYGQFFTPGGQLKISIEMLETEGELIHFKGKGEISSGQALSGKFTLKATTIGAIYPELSHKDEPLRDYFRKKFKELASQNE
jgi:3-hydroxyacyl-[acyl-carrier-protein] dehydratase